MITPGSTIAVATHSTFDKFELDKAELRENYFLTEVAYTGDPKELRKNHLLAILNVSSEADELQDEVAQAADSFAESLAGETPTKFAPHLCYTCKSCEYRTNNAQTRSGFAECWHGLATVEPHILDLYSLHLLGGNNRDLVEELAAAEKASLYNRSS